MGDLEASVDGVVIRDGDGRHSPLLGNIIQVNRIGETFRAAELLDLSYATLFAKIKEYGIK